jgi:hypothetical protein
MARLGAFSWSDNAFCCGRMRDLTVRHYTCGRSAIAVDSGPDTIGIERAGDKIS